MNTNRDPRSVLLVRRRELLYLGRSNDAQERELRGTIEPDWEDAAAITTAARTLETLGEVERQEILRIDAALERLRRGTYGRCVECGCRVTARRLATEPAAARCIACESAFEARR